jgi:hypothetical protein
VSREGSGLPARGYKWRDAWPDNELATKHGARSPRHVDPLSAALVEQLMSEQSTPAYLRDDPSYTPAIWAWARAEAKVMLLDAWLSEKPIEEQLKPPRNGTQAPLEVLRKWEMTAANHRARLGLDPTARARLQRDLVTSTAIAHGSLSTLGRLGGELVQQAEQRGSLTVVVQQQDGGDDDAA